MAKGLLTYRALHLAAFAFVLSGVAVACKEDTKDAGSPSAAGGSAGSGSGGSKSGGGSKNGEGGEPEQEAPRKGERGSSCNSSNDCEEGLSCIVSLNCPGNVACANKSCQPSNFDIMGTGKQCHIVECQTTKDCCGKRPLERPAKCANRDRICNQPYLAGCSPNVSCFSDADCGPGTCQGVCVYDAAPCKATADCASNTCDTSEEPHTCTLTGADCTNTTCATVVNSCSSLRCTNCENPDYKPTDPICSDPDCEDVCEYVCKDERCVVDTSCKEDADCPAAVKPFCSDSGQCVECLSDDDCDDEECQNGRCGPECEVDTQCPVFHACQSKSCVFVGCRSDRECVLGLGAASGQDPRLAKCKIEKGIGTCSFPCQIDAQCAPTEVCLDGSCEYIGCESDTECKTILGLHNVPSPTDDRPWVMTAVCRAEDAP